ncbi:MAG: 50S ribosomal protein L7ae [Lachnospiraceae bacterium]|nr:50S ribosomal protein L7ae [Lachnospiraceae bacterium]
MRKTLNNQEQVKKKVFSLIGLATRARKTVSGEFSTEKAVKSFAAELVIVAEDASDNTKKLFTDKCSFYEVPCFIYGTKEELGHAMGKEMRASLAVTDTGFAQALCKLLDETQN